MSERNIRFGTDIITFYDSALWGLEPGLSHPDWVAAFRQDPRRYFDGMLDLAADAGLEGIELAPEPADWEAALATYGDVGAFRSALEARGLVLTSSYAPGRQLIGDAMLDGAAEGVADDHMRRHAAFLADMGVDTIVIGNVARSRFGNASPDDTATADDFQRSVDPAVHDAFAAQLNRLGEVIRPFGVRMAIHTDAYSLCSRPEDVDQVMRRTDPATVGLCIDAGHIALDGGDPVEVLRTHVDRTPTMHWKDCAAPLSGHVLRGDQKARHLVMLQHFRVLGSGTVDWRTWMEVLRDHGWRGWATEEIDHSPDPVAELRAGRAYFERELAPIYR